ncbi:MAG: hypothetical protein JWM68_4897 [Verrucomicrobiales bacterium]|nr:hypothetical protein [Verrucomicrobiales bacterium]
MKSGPILRCLAAALALLCVQSASALPFTVDNSFNPGTGANGLVESTVVQSDHKILICGNFTTFNGTPHAYIARLNQDGSIDNSFNADVGYWVRHMALQSDGKIVIGGFFTDVQGIPRNRIARLNTSGTLDTSFDPGTGCETKIVPPDPLDPFVFAVAVQPNGKILIGGNFVTYNGHTNVGLVRVNTDGTRDTNFNVGEGVNSWVRSMLVQTNGQIMITGWFTSYDNHFHSRMALLNTDGSDVQSFNPHFGELSSVYTVAQVAGGKYIVAGHATDTNNPSYWDREMARLNADGSFDTNFLGYANEKVESVKIQPDGKIVMGGYFSAVNGVPRSNLARLNADGSLDSDFAPVADNYVWTIALQADGRILATGGFTTVDGVSRNGIARFSDVPSSNNIPVITLLTQTVDSRTAIFSGSTHLTSTLLNSGQPLNPRNRVVNVNDFNDDGKPDLIWQQIGTSPVVSIWYMDGTNVLSQSMLGNQPAVRGWRVAGSGDFNGDGKTDLVLQFGAHISFWFLNGTNVTSTNGMTMMAATWRLVGATDLDQDGQPDLVWQHPAGYLAMTHMNGAAVRDSVVLHKRVPIGWAVRALSDFSADGKADLLFQNGFGGINVWNFSDTNYISSSARGRIGTAWRVLGTY